jgi:integrase
LAVPIAGGRSGVEHHAALPHQQIPGFMQDPRLRSGISPRALEFDILTAARPGAVCLVTWDEIDLPKRFWNVPPLMMLGRLRMRTLRLSSTSAPRATITIPPFKIEN